MSGIDDWKAFGLALMLDRTKRQLHEALGLLVIIDALSALPPSQ